MTLVIGGTGNSGGFLEAFRYQSDRRWWQRFTKIANLSTLHVRDVKDELKTVTRSAVVVFLALVLVVSTSIVAVDAQSVTAKIATNPLLGQETKLQNAPAALQKAIVKTLGYGDSSAGQMTAKYFSAGAAITGANFQLAVGLGSIVRGNEVARITASVARSSTGAVYGNRAIEDRFHSSPSGVEQSFTIQKKIGGIGPLEIDVPVAGLRAVQAGGLISMVNSHGRELATYSNLLVKDAQGKIIPANLVAARGGSQVAIRINDRSAHYPLTVDPTWTQIAEFTASDGAANDYFGTAVAVSGQIALVGAPNRTVSGHVDQGSVYVFTLSGSFWTQSAELTSSDGAADDDFGLSVALSGTTAVVGALGHTASGHSGQGEIYVFNLSGGTWTQTTELTSSDGTASDNFGESVAISGNNIVVGATNGQGLYFFFEWRHLVTNGWAFGFRWRRRRRVRIQSSNIRQYCTCFRAPP